MLAPNSHWLTYREPYPFFECPEPPDEWPDVVPPTYPKVRCCHVPTQPATVSSWQGMLHGVLAFEKMMGAKVPTIPPDDESRGAQTVAIMR